MMNKFILVLIFILFTGGLHSQEKIYSENLKIQGSKELPLELNLLVESIDNAISEGTASISQESFIDKIMHIDGYARALNKEDIFLIGKIEIYKTLLKVNRSNPKAKIDGYSVNVLKEAIRISTDPFIKWFLQALLRDCDSLLGSTLFKEYILQKNNGKLERLELKKIDKKVQLIYRWVSKINPDVEDFQNLFRSEVFPFMIDSLENIKQSFLLMASNSSFEPLPKLPASIAELKFFSIKPLKKKAAKVEKKEKSVEDILAPINGEDHTKQPALPEPSKEDWLKDDNSPTSLKNLPKPKDDADWLEDF